METEGLNIILDVFDIYSMFTDPFIEFANYQMYNILGDSVCSIFACSFRRPLLLRRGATQSWREVTAVEEKAESFTLVNIYV